jgi:3-methylcrotonyl-CoA carboxylase alpha subunit
MKYRYQSGFVIYEVVLERRGESYRVTIDGQVYDVEVLNAETGALSLRLSDPTGSVRSHVVYWAAEGGVKWLSSHGCTYRLERPTPRRSRSARGAAPEDSLRAPMPARVRAVQVAEGDAVEAGQTLLLLEAMKMEIRLQAPRAGRVARLLASTGETVEREQVLVELESEQ